MRVAVVLLLIAVTITSAQYRGRAPETGAVTKLLQILKQEARPEQAHKDVETIWRTDRWFTFPKFEETAKNVAAIMKRAGLEDVEIGNPPADGKTQGGFWTLPLAWDVKVGTLEILDPQVPTDQRMLADYQKVPASLCMWSGPTPSGPVETEIVSMPATVRDGELKGKLVLSSRNAKTALIRGGALGL